MKHRFSLRLIVCLSILIVSCKTSESATDETVKYEPGGILISVPSGWKTKRESNKLILNSPNSAITMIFFAPAERGMEAGMAQVDKNIKHRRNTGVDMRDQLISDQMKIQNYYLQ